MTTFDSTRSDAAFAAAAAGDPSPVIPAPVAAQRPEVLEIHGDRRIDPYYWLRDRANPEVLAYLKAENAYTAAQMASTAALQQRLYDEILGRIQETDLSVPYRHGDYDYYVRTEAGKAYGIHCRRHATTGPEAAEELLLDENALAEGQDYFDLGDFEISPSHQRLAYSTDIQGDERYTLMFLDLDNGERYPESIPEVGGVAWANDNETVFYLRLDDNNRPFQLWRHRLGTLIHNDDLVYEETDEAFYLGVGTTRSQAYILLSSDSKITSEVRFLDANHPEDEFRLLHPRQAGVEYSVAHHPGLEDAYRSDRFYIVTNDGAINFKLMLAQVSRPDKAHWQEIIPHREDIMLSGIDVFADHLVIYERERGLPTIRLQKLSTGEVTKLDFPEPTYSVSGGFMPEFDSQTLRFTYSSLVTPSTVFDYDMDRHGRELKKEQPVLGDFDRSQYVSERLLATAPDGTAVPISLVYKKGHGRDSGPHPLHLTGYGSYGYPYPVSFSAHRLSLLDRGVVYAIAHIRGGGELGRRWYEDGKFLHKANTFTDFIACAECLIDQGWTAADRLTISGGSAGGLLMGAVVNLRPQLFHAAIAQVPFVDVVTTILDPDLPLSVIEWDEWGNPNEVRFYDYMKSYSPYDNVKAQDYPHLLITAGLNDPRVSYWEPAKWTAKLRSLKTDQNRLLLKTHLGAGHGGASDRYERIKEIALEYAFLLDCLGLAGAGQGD